MSRPTRAEVLMWVDNNLSQEPLDELGGYDPWTLVTFDLNQLAVLMGDHTEAREQEDRKS